MKRIKQLFIEFRQTTPKHIQWLLLAAAFVVVLILLTLLVGKHVDTGNSKPKVKENKTIEWSFVPAELNFVNTIVGESKSQTVTLTVSDTVFIDDIHILDEENNDWMYNNNCSDKPKNNTCDINMVYEPHTEQPETKTSLVIKYHLPDNDDTEQKEIPVIYSANNNTKSQQPESLQKIEPEQPVNDVDEEEKSADITESDTVSEQDVNDSQEDVSGSEGNEELPNFQETAAKQISIIAPTNPFENVLTEQRNDIVLPSRSCSDFAIPGYNQSGIQIGWIKPDRGANYFHPFSDKDCSNPTGKYDWATGVITSLKDGSKIGTDADHIGYRNVKNRGLTLEDIGLSAPKNTSLSLTNGKFGANAKWVQIGDNEDPSLHSMQLLSEAKKDKFVNVVNTKKYLGSADKSERVISSQPYDRTFILRQFKPIPATIVSEVRADASVYGCSTLATGESGCDPKKNYSIPVRATVDRNVYSDDGRTIIIPTGTLLMGYLAGELPGPYQSFGRMNIKWYQFIRPDGVEFNFPNTEEDPYSGDAQGRVGVPGRGSTDYVEQMVIPILTAMVPAAVNMIAPIADSFVNQINLDNNTVVQSGTIRSSEMAKQEIINQWNRITNKLVVDAISNTVPPFSIPAGTRINVYSPVDLVVNCPDIKGKKCSFSTEGEDNPRRSWKELKADVRVDRTQPSWIGQVRSWDLDEYCDDSSGKWTIKDNSWQKNKYDYDYRTILLYCESKNYVAKNLAKDAVYNQNVKDNATDTYGNVTYTQDAKTGLHVTQTGTDEQKKAYNEEVLGLQYADDDKTILNPFAKPAEDEVLTCDDGSAPDMNGCCPGETYTDMGEDGFNCCPDSGGNCFPPIIVE